ncbi:MAG: metal-sensitive transcriptional regulator [Bowdeniella nasicola]|nr:metal-sensitive transcriptional regulator [Bowdeniella nasicola]
MVSLDPAEAQAARNRLARANGQLAAVIRALDEGGDCRTILTQLAAASTAVDRAAVTLLATALRECYTQDAPEAAREELEKLFLSFT